MRSQVPVTFLPTAQVAVSGSATFPPIVHAQEGFRPEEAEVARRVAKGGIVARAGAPRERVEVLNDID